MLILEAIKLLLSLKVSKVLGKSYFENVEYDMQFSMYSELKRVVSNRNE